MSRPEKGLVVDANILVRAALGPRVRAVLRQFHRTTSFWVPEVCRIDARRKIPEICGKRKLDQNEAIAAFDYVETTVEFVTPQTYAAWEQAARKRILRDPDDWPIVATALSLELPIWTEDRDFFGCGVATWITNMVEIYLRL